MACSLAPSCRQRAGNGRASGPARAAVSWRQACAGHARVASGAGLSVSSRPCVHTWALALLSPSLEPAWHESSWPLRRAGPCSFQAKPRATRPNRQSARPRKGPGGAERPEVLMCSRVHFPSWAKFRWCATVWAPCDVRPDHGLTRRRWT